MEQATNTERPPHRGLRVLIAGTWDRGPGYPRTDALRAALAELGCEVQECRVDPPGGGRSKVALVSQPWRWPGYLRASRATRRALRTALCEAILEFEPDLVLVPYPGHLAVRVVREVFQGPVVLDLFLSAWSTAVVDRRLFPAWSPPARYLRHLDAAACEAADLVLLDTPQHAEDVCLRTGLPAERFDWVPVCDPAAGLGTVKPPRRPQGAVRVLFFGTGVPLHGLPVWIEALAGVPELRVTLVGGDPGSRRRAVAMLGERLELLGQFESMARIRAEIDRADLVCGIVGTSAKARLVVPYKVVHALAHGRPVLTSDSAAVRSLLTPGTDCLVAPPGDPRELAAALRAFLALPGEERIRIGQAARRRFDESFSVAAVARRLNPLLDRLVGAVPRPSESECSQVTDPRGRDVPFRPVPLR